MDLFVYALKHAIAIFFATHRLEGHITPARHFDTNLSTLGPTH